MTMTMIAPGRKVAGTTTRMTMIGRGKRRRDDDDDDDDDDRPRGKKKKKKGRQEGDTGVAVVHLLCLLTTWVGPLILWLVKRKDSKFIDHHGKEALNFGFGCDYWTILCVLWWMLALLLFSSAVSSISSGDVSGFAAGWGAAAITSCVLYLIGLALGLYFLIICIIAMIKANQGEWFRYPLSIRMIR